ncbi:hypothetical protein [Agrobacterium vitis]|uniref:hypothetical protein n=1 Tax=Agrobacterium vitis TaxID=373 RepID=UPI0008DBF502|nr:hypothetical protein [Agrobacterium vitis]MUO84767.1 hypothetical protein [Agrobacterium vitis]MVA33669.1 hypothetical protein [Agrobacterium vitis]
MAKYAMRPMIVDAIRYDWSGGKQTAEEIQAEIAALAGGTVIVKGEAIEVVNDFGTVSVAPGEWFVKSGMDQFGSSDNALFVSTHDALGD